MQVLLTPAQRASRSRVPMVKNMAELIARHVITQAEGLRFAENPGYLDEVVAALHTKRSVT